MSHISAPTEVATGAPRARAEELLPPIYQELRRLAAHKMAGGRAAETLQPTALVHEAWLRLTGGDGAARYSSRTHFFAAAAEAMRHILIDRARRRQAARHGGGQQRAQTAVLAGVAAPVADDELLAVNAALNRLQELDPAKAEVVKLRYFAGLSIEETAAALGISEPTVKRRWAMARAWLFHEIHAQREEGRSLPGARLNRAAAGTGAADS